MSLPPVDAGPVQVRDAEVTPALTAAATPVGASGTIATIVTDEEAVDALEVLIAFMAETRKV
jgi:hypothetical protein